MFDFKINTTKVFQNEIRVYASYKLGKQIEKPVTFTLNNENGNYTIINSRGLSAYYGTEFHQFLTLTGCLETDADDATINQECLQREGVYNGTIEAFKKNIESQIVVDNSSLNLNGGYYVSGAVKLYNNSDFEIPSNAYSVYIGFLNLRNKEGNKELVSQLHPSILPKQSVSIPVNYVSVPSYIRNGDKVSGIFSITNSSPLQQLLNEIVSATTFNCNELDSIIQI